MPISGGISQFLMQACTPDKPATCDRVNCEHEFCKFSHLPAELQLYIWEYAAADESSVSRVHEITCKANRKRSIDNQYELYIPPSLLHACHDSRIIAIKKYQHLDFGGQLTHPIYFNPKIDVLYFPDTQKLLEFMEMPFECATGCRTMVHQIAVQPPLRRSHPAIDWDTAKDPQGLQCLRQIAVGVHFWDCPWPVVQALSRLKGLRHIAFVQPARHRLRKVPPCDLTPKQAIDVAEGEENERRCRKWVECFQGPRIVEKVRRTRIGNWTGQSAMDGGWLYPDVFYLPVERLGKRLF